MIIDDGSGPHGKSTLRRAASYAVVLVAAAVAIYGLSEFVTPVPRPAQGDCAHVSGRVAKPDLHVVGCRSVRANFVVTGTVPRSESCRDAHTDLPTRRWQDPEIRICLVPLWAEGACYPVDSARVEPRAISCDREVFRVTRVSRDLPAPPCAAGEERLSYPAVTLTYCTATL